MKRIIALLLLMISLLATVPVAGAFSTYETGWYVVDCTNPNGYCYLYDQPSDIYGRNLGRYNNGAIVFAYGKDRGYFLVETYDDGKIGYIHDYALRPYEEYQTTTYRVYSTSPRGYCYMYEQPSDSDSVRNLGCYNNGAFIEVIDWNADRVYARVWDMEYNRYGYIRKAQLVLPEYYPNY